MDRCPPIHNQATTSALNNAHAVYVHQVNDHRKAYQATLYKLLADQTTRVRHGQHANRKYYDDERSRVNRARARNDDFERHLNSQIEAAQRNEKDHP